MPICPIQDVCNKYLSGDNKPPNHQVRLTVPCKDWLSMECEMGTRLQVWMNNGEGIACSIAKHSKVKK